MDSIVKQNAIDIIKRQTTYTQQEIEEKLQAHNHNIEHVILEYHGIDLESNKKKEFETLSTNQKIFKSIRDFF